MTEHLRNKTSEWFRDLRDVIRQDFEKLEIEYSTKKNLPVSLFEVKEWERDGGGGGEISIMRGNLFEKVGVNISTVHGKFSEEFRKQIPGAEEDPVFFATGISLVAHMKSPFVPAVHFNTRYIETSKSWFGGGADLTPTFEEEEETLMFHDSFKKICDKHNPEYHPKFKKQCDEYFYLEYRKEPRGIGGIFYDYLNSGNPEEDFSFTKDVGLAFREIYPAIVDRKSSYDWTEEQKEAQLIKRGRYVEFNLLHDRGTKFGLMTGGNIDAILTSLPPGAKW